jgi:ribosomal protein L37AE/L43A
MDQPTAAGDNRMNVYKTTYGEKYHKSTCHNASGELTETTEKMAQQMGLEKCERCIIGDESETPDDPVSEPSQSVYKTTYGRKYHKSTCSHVSGELVEISETMAQERGLRKCSDCFAVDESETPHCPECESSQVVSRKGGIQVNDDQKTETEWRCRDCKEPFAEPLWIATSSPVIHQSLAGELVHDYDAEDVVPPSEVDQ